MCIAVQPRAFLLFTSALNSISFRMHSTEFSDAAIIIGVIPSLSGKLGFAPLCKSNSAIGSFFDFTAMWVAVSPFCVQHITVVSCEFTECSA